MNQPSAMVRSWTRARWAGMIALILGTQLGLIFWLSDPRPPFVRKPAPAPLLALVDHAPGAWLALENPALFALPQREGFSGQSWFAVPQLPFQPFDWDEPPHFLVLQPNQLGAEFNRLAELRNVSPDPGSVHPPPELTLPQVGAARIAAPESSLRVEGELASRPLLSTPRLPSWPGVDLLTNTVIRVLVDPEGNPVSFTLLSPSRYKPADEFAIEATRAVRFSPAPNPPPPQAGLLACLSRGLLIFSWQTVPVTNTNLAAAPR